MAEISRPWSGTVTGDAGPYSDDQWTDVWKTLLAPVIASQGVFQDELNELAIGGFAASPVTINTGRALVNGIWYESDASVDVAVPTPAVNPRVDRIVLRADWALQTVRITRIAGVEAAAPAPPALVQNDGVTWDLPLWQVFITVGGVISAWRDEREFIGQYEPVGLSDTKVYLEEDFFVPGSNFNDNDHVGAFEVVLDITPRAGVNATNILGFGSGGLTFDHDGTGTGGQGAIISQEVSPNAINARLRMRAKQPNTDAVLDRMLGMVSAVSTITPGNGVYFRADGVGNWFAVTRVAGVETATDTAQALDDVWRVFEIRQIGTDLVTFLIDGVVVATHTTDIPTDGLLLATAILDDGVGTPANADYLDLDYTKLQGTR